MKNIIYLTLLLAILNTIYLLVMTERYNLDQSDYHSYQQSVNDSLQAQAAYLGISGSAGINPDR